MKLFCCIFAIVTMTSIPAQAAILLFGDLISAGDITLIGDVDVLASGVTFATGGGPGDDLRIVSPTFNGNDGLTMDAGLGNIHMSIGNTYNSTATTLLEGDTIIIDMDEPSYDPSVGATLNILGNINSMTLLVSGGDGPDVFNLALDDNSAMTLDGGVGFDTVNVSGGGLATFTSPGAGTITKPGFATISFSNIESILGVQVQSLVVPEPTTAVLGLMGVAGLVMRRRKAA